MKIAIAADHAGFQLKDHLLGWLQEGGHEVVDFGTDSEQSADYPDFAAVVARSVAGGVVERGILICSTGVGMSIAANKIAGVRAALAADEEAVQLTRSHNDANILSLGARSTSTSQAERYLQLFLETPFEGGRHLRRVQKIAELERAL